MKFMTLYAHGGQTGHVYAAFGYVRFDAELSNWGIG